MARQEHVVNNAQSVVNARRRCILPVQRKIDEGREERRGIVDVWSGAERSPWASQHPGGDRI
jgi:hypothetical protein